MTGTPKSLRQAIRNGLCDAGFGGLATVGSAPFIERAVVDYLNQKFCIAYLENEGGEIENVLR